MVDLIWHEKPSNCIATVNKHVLASSHIHVHSSHIYGMNGTGIV